MIRAAYPLDEARQLLGGLSRSTLYRLEARGELRLVRLGHRVLVPASEIERLVEGRAQASADAGANKRDLRVIDGEVRTDIPARAWLRHVRAQLIAAYPGFGFDVPGVPSGPTSEQLRGEFAAWSTSDLEVDTPTGRMRLAETPAARGLTVYLRARAQALAAAAERHGVSEGGFATAISTAYLRAWLRSVARWVAASTGPEGINPDFIAIYDRAYASEVDEVETTEMLPLDGVEFPVGG